MAELSGTTALVSGAGRGLGAALAMALADAGCRPILCGRNPAALEDVAGRIRSRTGLSAPTARLDLADAESIADAVARIGREHHRLDILINNAAMWLEAREDGYSAGEVVSVVTAAVSGTFLLTQGLMPLLTRSDRPDILTIGSISGLPNAAIQTVSVPFYAAKRAQAALADGLAQTLAGTPVRSQIVHPPYLDDLLPDEDGWISSQGRRKGERATNRDVVEAVLFALSRPRHISLSIVVNADEGGLYPG